MSQATLFDEPDLDDARHMLMPNMSVACGLDLLELYASRTGSPHPAITLTTADVTCPACAVLPLHQLCSDMQRRQA